MNVTTVESREFPKLFPVIVRTVPTVAEVGEMLEILGVTRTVNNMLLLATPFTVTTTGPVVAALGTVMTICASLQLVTLACIPLKVTVLDPWVVPKYDPLTLTVAPTAAIFGDSAPMTGARPVEPCPVVNERELPLARP